MEKLKEKRCKICNNKKTIKVAKKTNIDIGLNKKNGVVKNIYSK